MNVLDRHEVRLIVWICCGCSCCTYNAQIIPRQSSTMLCSPTDGSDSFEQFRIAPEGAVSSHLPRQAPQQACRCAEGHLRASRSYKHHMHPLWSGRYDLASVEPQDSAMHLLLLICARQGAHQVHRMQGLVLVVHLQRITCTGSAACLS